MFALIKSDTRLIIRLLQNEIIEAKLGYCPALSYLHCMKLPLPAKPCHCLRTAVEKQSCFIYVHEIWLTIQHIKHHLVLLHVFLFIFMFVTLLRSTCVFRILFIQNAFKIIFLMDLCLCAGKIRKDVDRTICS